ncbi:MAG: 3-hydroxyacyl-ACP dehydratase FabZ [Sulfurihydrogenibium sp.]|jgi:3-hydroxyacyl-[acyl-carrier-protein] dehydratase|uniref:3-hydroxyacyl-[acyl-carrier-protein] dehydratase FabZ n=1 Tax=Sulfurihydrogenibium azorense TaxID=309806 RepID=A0A831YCH1_9AQUI|nr:MAG: 3-hydroxyacyl-[acyl-carrier-protein] dehydratase FabZ [Sulfurihydrogenibium sp.]PMP77088.1 MAG: 3-hydroxyacyl-[acyl-carrier-protein] dehydratase FabZ [Sulfurihydrogenibium sp.]HEV08964.1 3-hydroxyacyl-ACP dehydratase FabZ [Sulfurihydrogenibium azorense]
MENVMDIMKVLPHRYPFLLVDRILELDVENMKIKALKNVTYNEPFFVGHFPDNPVMPGVLIIEAMAQVGAYLMLKKANITNGTVLFASIEEAKFRKPVVPGDQIIFEVEGINIKKSMGKIKAVAKVDGQVVCEAILMAAVK